MATWTPDPTRIPWLEVNAADTFVSEPITAIDEDATPAHRYELAIITPRTRIIGLEWRGEADGLVVSVPKVITGLYPPEEIEFQTQLPGDLRQTGWCEDFPEIPGEAVEVIRFSPRTEGLIDWTLRVTAFFLDLLGNETSENQDYILRVMANWTPGRDALKGAVDARRR